MGKVKLTAGSGLLFFFSGIFFQSAAQRILKVEKENNMFKAPCFAVGHGFNFSCNSLQKDASITLREVNLLLNKKYLSASDLQGTSPDELENEQLTPDSKVVLKEMIVAGLKVFNVSVSIVPFQPTPIVIGRSVMDMIGTFSLDTSNLTLTITDAPEKNFINETTLKKSEKFVGNWSADKKYKFINLNMTTLKATPLLVKPNPGSSPKRTIPPGMELYVYGLNIEEGFDYLEVKINKEYGFVNILDIQP